jgi:hypothetical protein
MIRSSERSIEIVVPLPSRLSALIGKAAALGLPDGRDRHLLDAIHLAATLRPSDLDEPLSKADRRWLRHLLQVADGDPVWSGADERVTVLSRSALARVSSLIG